MEISKGFRSLVAEAEEQVQSLSTQEAKDKCEKEGVLLIDLRDIREVKREGKISNSLHIPRGMLEFWVDPDSPYYRKEFDNVDEVVLYCNKGWRSALAAQSLMSMGLEKVSHISGGMEQWLADGREIDAPPEKS
jgi:rhodanese-related sulfurtransferase